MNRSGARFARKVNLPVLLLQIFLLLVVVVPETGSAFRENDGGSYISGAYQLVHRQASPVHNQLYNYDKQYGAFALLAMGMRLFPNVDPVLTANVLQVLIVGLGMLACAFLPRRSRSALILLVPVLLFPAWVFSAPFFSPASISGAMLFLAIVAMNALPSSWAHITGSVLTLVAVSFRADAVLLIPLLIWSQSPRMPLRRAILRPWVVALCISAAILVGLGRLTLAGGSTEFAGFILNMKYFLVCLIFGFGAAALVYAACLAGLLRASLIKSGWAWWYLAGFACAFAPIAFYALQIHSPRYFFLTNLAGFCFVASRRYRLAIPRLAGSQRLAAAGLLLAAFVPWAVGLDMPSLRNIRPTVANPTQYLTADGHMPMGAYLAFAHQVPTLDRFQIDHNQQIWLSALSVKYDRCGAGVPLLFTPMWSLVQLAVTLQGQQPLHLGGAAVPVCGFAYADLRSLTHGLVDASPESDIGVDILKRYAIDAVSTPGSAQPIVRVDFSRPADPLSRLALAMRRRFDGREIEFRLNYASAFSGFQQITRDPWAQYIFFSAGGRCDFEGLHSVEESDADFSYWTVKATPELAPDQPEFRCTSPSLAGYVRDVLPLYMAAGQQ